MVYRAKVPLFVLVIWMLVIIVGKIQSADSHNLWSFELFAWAMMNMVYMVTIMTIKRIDEKNVDPSTTKRLIYPSIITTIETIDIFKSLIGHMSCYTLTCNTVITINDYGLIKFQYFGESP